MNALNVPVQAGPSSEGERPGAGAERVADGGAGEDHEQQPGEHQHAEVDVLHGSRESTGRPCAAGVRWSAMCRSSRRFSRWRPRVARQARRLASPSPSPAVRSLRPRTKSATRTARTPSTATPSQIRRFHSKRGLRASRAACCARRSRPVLGEARLTARLPNGSIIAAMLRLVDVADQLLCEQASRSAPARLPT